MSEFATAGVTDVALVQIGGEHQEQFLAEAAAFRAAFGNTVV